MKYSFLKRFVSFIMTAALAVVISIPADASTTVRDASWGISDLTSIEQPMYNHLVSELERIISQGGATEITFDGLQFDTDDISGDKVNAGILWDDIYTCVSFNHPELLFFEEINPDDEDASDMTVGPTSFSVKIGVDKKYRGSDEYTLSTNAASIASSAKSTADAVISKNSNKGTYDTIKAYADWIADNVSYDHSAARLSASEITDNSPWNAISVFDNDSSTNVVCEGYAKAFQYLMDNTPRFVSAGITSKIVTSTVPVTNGSSSAVSGSSIGADDETTGHMWNVVTIAGKNYLVDVTWYDTDSAVPYRTKYLLGGEEAAESDTSGLHEYDSDTTGFYSYDELELSESAYDSSIADPLNPGTSGSTGNTGNTSDTGSNGNTGNTGSSGTTGTNTGSGTSDSTSSSSGTGTNTGSTTGNTSSGSTSSGTSNTSGSTSSNSSSSNTQSTEDTTPVQYNSTGAVIGGDQTVSATTTYTAPQTGDTSYPFADTYYETEAETEQSTQIASIESKKGSVFSISAGSKKLTIKFKKVSVSGKTVKYQVALKQSTAKSWKKSYVSSTKKTFSGLKKGKTYWVSVRPYITVDGSEYFGQWSKTLAKKVK
jgi:hypothetical protein